MYKLLCMSFDGDYQLEHPKFKTAEKVWEYANDLGNKWFFYPFCFVVSQSGETIVDAPLPFEFLKGKRVKTVQALFKKYSELPELENADTETFAYYIADQEDN